MCRLLGIVASESTEFGLGLTRAPRCLANLSREHRDGWGIAIFDGTKRARRTDPWALHKGTAPAGDDRRFHELAAQSSGHVLVAHVRQKTVGPTRLENTHPFERDGWVFAHNGTIQATEALRRNCSRTRLAEISGDTDSELFFAYLLTRFDEEGLGQLTDMATRTRATEFLHGLLVELRAARIGAFNFLLSDGETTFAHRFGRSLFVLDRRPQDPVLEKREVSPGATILTPWTGRRKALLIASERITDEPWEEVPDETLLRFDRSPEPQIVADESTVSQRVAS